MKYYMLAGLVAAQSILAVQPAAAAGFEEMTTVQSGTFTGARIRLSLGGRQHDRKFRAGLTIAPTLRSQSMWGATRTRFGEGLELGFAGERPLTLSLGGRPVSRLAPGGRKSEDNRRLGVSTGGKVAIGAGVVALVAGAIVLGVVISHSDDAPDES
ncbi:MAG: hypothetical protein ACR2FK_06275 [Sphingomicrobium sp.]